MALVGLTLLGTFIWDRLCVLFFAPEIFKAEMNGPVSQGSDGVAWQILAGNGGLCKEDHLQRRYCASVCDGGKGLILCSLAHCSRSIEKMRP